MTPNPAPTVEQIADRFWSKVDKRDAGCWEWLGYKNGKGYGNFSLRDGIKSKTYKAHRFAFFLRNGAMPKQVIDHLCRNPSCVNPDHLEDVSAYENNLRGEGVTAQNAKKSVCVNGHDLSGHNLVVVRTKGRPDRRGCRKCRYANTQKWKDRHRTPLAEQVKAFLAGEGKVS